MKNTTTALERTNPRRQYLAVANPVIEKVQIAYLGEISRLYESSRQHYFNSRDELIDCINDMLRAGQLTFGFLADADIPGKFFTPDLFHQMAGKGKGELDATWLWVQGCQQVARAAALRQGVEVSAAKPIKPIEDTRDFLSTVKRVYGADTRRAEKQRRIAGLDAWTKTKAIMESPGFAPLWADLQLSPDHFKGGQLRDDLLLYAPAHVKHIDADVAAMQEYKAALLRKI